MWLMLHSKSVFEDKTTNHCDWQGASISFVSRVLVLSHFSLFYFLLNARSHTLRVPFPPISVSRSNGRFYWYFMANFDARSLVTSNPGRWVVSFDRSWQESKGAIDWEMQQETPGETTSYFINISVGASSSYYQFRVISADLTKYVAEYEYDVFTSFNRLNTVQKVFNSTSLTKSTRFAFQFGNPIEKKELSLQRFRFLILSLWFFSSFLARAI